MTDICTMPGCDNPTRDAGYICEDCADAYAKDLKSLINNLDDELDAAVAGTRGIDWRRGRVGGGEDGIKVNLRAAEVYRRLHRALCDTVDHCIRAKTRNTSPIRDEPARTIAAMALWLTWRVDGLCLDPAAVAYVEAIGNLVVRAKAVVEWEPRERAFLGECELCEGLVYADPDDPANAACDRCKAAFPAETRRLGLLSAADDRLLTAADIAHLSTYLGLDRDREQVRKLINRWSSRKVIEVKSGEGETSKFRFGDVYRRLIKDAEGRDAAHEAALAAKAR